MTSQISPQKSVGAFSLDPIFNPRSVAVIGAKDTPGSVGRTLMANLIRGGFSGALYPVNPNRKVVLEKTCYPTVKDIPDEVDVAVIVVPAPAVLGVVQQCVEKHIKGCIIISAGFKETGPEGKAREDAIVSMARHNGMRVVGPNCLGIMNPYSSLNATFAKGMALSGSIAFVSQSGALCAAVLDWSFQERVGFSSFVSIGSMADVDWGDMLDYFGNDPKTKCILLYMETVGNPKKFLQAARKVAEQKPIIILKPGRSSEAAHAATSHTGALLGRDDVFDAACEKCGIIRVNTISELFSIAEVLSCQPLPKGPRLAIMTNAGGPSVLATDALVQSGGTLASLEKKTVDALSEFLPPAWPHGNPVDVLGDADPERYRKAGESVLSDKNVDGLLVILTPQDMTDPTNTAQGIVSLSNPEKKPIIASWMGGPSVHEGHLVFSKASIPNLAYPDEAAWTFSTIWKYADAVKTLRQTATKEEQCSQEIVDRQARSREMLRPFIEKKQSILTETESKNLLQLWNIPVVETIKAETKEDAVKLARKLGYPVALKIDSHIITHKTQVGGVQLRLTSDDEVRAAFDRIRDGVLSKYTQDAFSGVSVQKMVSFSGPELIVGSSQDPEFGPVILFGSGGIYVEAFQDSALGLPPISLLQAEKMIEKTKMYKVLKKKGPHIVQSLQQFLVSFSEMIVALPEIKECDINPLLALDAGVIALDARIVI